MSYIIPAPNNAANWSIPYTAPGDPTVDGADNPFGLKFQSFGNTPAIGIEDDQSFIRFGTASVVFGGGRARQGTRPIALLDDTTLGLTWGDTTRGISTTYSNDTGRPLEMALSVASAIFQIAPNATGNFVDVIDVEDAQRFIATVHPGERFRVQDIGGGRVYWWRERA